MDRTIKVSLRPKGALVRQVADVQKSLMEDGYEVVVLGSRVSVIGLRDSCGDTNPLSRSEAQRCLSVYQRSEVGSKEFNGRLLVEVIASYK